LVDSDHAEPFLDGGNGEVEVGVALPDIGQLPQRLRHPAIPHIRPCGRRIRYQ